MPIFSRKRGENILQKVAGSRWEWIWARRKSSSSLSSLNRKSPLHLGWLTLLLSTLSMLLLGYCPKYIHRNPFSLVVSHPDGNFLLGENLRFENKIHERLAQGLVFSLNYFPRAHLQFFQIWSQFFTSFPNVNAPSFTNVTNSTFGSSIYLGTSTPNAIPETPGSTNFNESELEFIFMLWIFAFWQRFKMMNFFRFLRLSWRILRPPPKNVSSSHNAVFNRSATTCHLLVSS